MITENEQATVDRINRLVTEMRRPLWVFTAAHGFLNGESESYELRLDAVKRRTHAAVELERIIHNYVMNMRDGEDASR